MGENRLNTGFDEAAAFFDEVTKYIGFGPGDSALLAEFLPLAEPSLERISDHFYERIFQDPLALQIITGGEEQVIRLKRTLVEWMRNGLSGPHDEAFCRLRARVGDVHVRIGLPQRFMITAMNVMRIDLRQVSYATFDMEHGDRDQLERLHIAIDRLCDLDLAIMLETYKREAEDRLRRRERLATIGQLAANISHDLRNPLSVMESSLYILRRRIRDDPRVTKHVDKISQQIDECDAIITHLLEMARNQPPRREVVDAAELLDEAIAAARIPAEFSVEREGFAGLKLWVDGGLLKQALVNVFINAAQAQAGMSGQVRVEAELEGRDVTISVLDRGQGFDTQTLPRVFEPLITTKATGTGLGLALVRSVTERHDGRVSANNRVGGGAVVRLYLPDAVPAVSNS